MDDFERLLAEHRGAAERYIRFRLPTREDADDVLQETCLAAFRRFGQLKNRDSFKAWLISIARSKCADFYRSRSETVSLEEAPPAALVQSRYGLTERSEVLDTLDLLGDKERQVLRMFYFEGMKLSEIAGQLQIPEGTVKSRLHTAKSSFRRNYPYPPKGANDMKKLPEIMPEYRIIPSKEKPFPVKWEELMGWFVVPRQGERCCWAMYDFPERRRGEYVEISVDGRAEIHGLEGVLVRTKEYDAMPCNRIDGSGYAERVFVAQLTETHCRFLAESHTEKGVKKLHTFLDAEEFLPNWGFGEDNCGNEIRIEAKGDIVREGSAVTAKDKHFLLDVVGRYTVELGGRSFDTICVIDIETYDESVMSEQYLDKNGRTVLWRRFNRNDWRMGADDRLWTERLPRNERVTVNGETYVHWYDCITDYVL